MKTLSLITLSALLLVNSSSVFAADMGNMKMGAGMHMHQSAQSAPQMVTVKATIKAISTKHHKIKVAHEAISEWGWPAMVMAFEVADGQPLSQLHKGQQVQLMLHKKTDGSVIAQQVMVE
ncbi:copper-binding protein [Paraferrimonas haliotis]|uniref:Cu(I)/Ag(I) efflux system protein CusF n=1 Tax=Paraferrimonas haliotis TaxID=2013866 RepID=A0AA37TMA2_9GAMM|nr:copper-binding protein [Paraferrimonas haliotis]GLS84104.1 hypothetical protein GCM10007894_20810 [Paraferrimonas haliotis]